MSAHPHLRLVPDHPGPAFSGQIAPDDTLTIDCAVCVALDTAACDDCVVTCLVGHEVGTPVVLDPEERRAVDLLAEAGLVPASRFSPRPGVA
ncbi:MAG: hypothetical protein R8F63_08015 [Acidimicrobiales bacterium]|nr:hypothetical protein [Acidimicrobiales bacterium]